VRLGQDRCELGNDAWLIPNPEAQVVGPDTLPNRPRLVVPQDMPGEWRRPSGNAPTELASKAHQVAYDGHTCRLRSGAPPVVEGVLTPGAANPDRVVGPLDVGQDRVLRDQGGLH
jgi:hypothetical protein